MPRPFRIAFIPTSNAGVNYTRMAAWAFEMRKYRNVEAAVLYFQYQTLDVHPWQKDFTSVPQIRQDIECLARASDVMVWQPVHYDNTLQFFNEIHQKYGKPMFVETDDNHMDVPPWNNAYNAYAPSSFYRHVVNKMMGWSDGLIVSTPHLKEVYAPFNDNINIVENSLNFNGDRRMVGWDKVSVRKHRGIRIGWIGGRSHFNDLMMVAPALKDLLCQYPDVTLVLVNSALKPSCEALGIKYPFEGLANVHYADRSVPINRFAPFMASFGMDIGIAPLVDCSFNRSKSNLRWLEYAALKIPCVATDISHYSQTVRNGKDGLLIKNNDLQEWKNALELLIKDASMREELGRQAYRRVKKDFNIKTNAAKYTRLLKKISDFNVFTPEYEEVKPGQLVEVA